MDKMQDKIIFVDDEKKVLEGIKRSLFSLRKEFNFIFIDDPVYALKVLEQESSVDAVVTSMKMQQVNGLEILKKTYTKHPQALRLVLSGDKQEILDTLGFAHQFLIKPVEPEALKTILKRAQKLRKYFDNLKLLKIVGQLKSLPVLPKIYRQLKEALEENNISPQKLAQIIMQDIGLTSKILQLVNSVFFGLVRRITNIEEAIVFLGIDTISALVLSIPLFEEMKQVKLKGFSLEKIAHHSINVASILKELGKKEGFSREKIDRLFLAGLIHDCGLIVLTQNFPKQYEQVLKLVREKNFTLDKAEEKIFGISHAEIGAYLLNMWGIPEEIISIVFYHHNPLKVKQDFTKELDEIFLINLAEFMESNQEKIK